MQLRNIKIDDAVNIYNNPNQIIIGNEVSVYQSIVIEKDGNYLIRIFVNHEKEPNLVITAYKTSKISKYYEGEI